MTLDFGLGTRDSAVVDREEQPGENATRERHEEEEKLFKERLYGKK